MANTKNTKNQVVVRAKQLIAGTAKHLASTPNIVLSGSSFTPDQITSKLQQLVNLRADAEAAKAAAAAKIATEKAQAPALIALLSECESFAKVTFGSSPDVLADFGIAPKTSAAPTAETKAAAVVKRAATRAARHTMGPKQKQGIVGNVTGVLMTPITAPSPVVTTPAPTGPTAPATSAGPTTGAPATPHTA
jgi:hypothetical protein